MEIRGEEGRGGEEPTLGGAQRSFQKYIYRKREKVMVVAVVMTIIMRRRSKRGTW